MVHSARPLEILCCVHSSNVPWACRPQLDDTHMQHVRCQSHQQFLRRIEHRMFGLLFERRICGRDRITMREVQCCIASEEMSRGRKHALQFMCKLEGHYLQHLQAKPASHTLLSIRAKSICNYTMPRMLGGLLAVSQDMHHGSYVRHRHQFMLELL